MFCARQYKYSEKYLILQSKKSVGISSDLLESSNFRVLTSPVCTLHIERGNAEWVLHTRITRITYKIEHILTIFLYNEVPFYCNIFIHNSVAKVDLNIITMLALIRLFAKKGVSY